MSSRVMSRQASGSTIPFLAPPPIPKRSPLRVSSAATGGSSTQQAPSSIVPQHKENCLMGQTVVSEDVFRRGRCIVSAPSGSLSHIHDKFDPTHVVLSSYSKARLKRRAHIRRPRSKSNPDFSVASRQGRADLAFELPRPLKPTLFPIITEGLPSQLATKQVKVMVQRIRSVSVPPTLQNAGVVSGPRVRQVFVPNPILRPASIPQKMHGPSPGLRQSFGPSPKPRPASMPRDMHGEGLPSRKRDHVVLAPSSLVSGPYPPTPPTVRPLPTPSSSLPQSSSLYPPLFTVAQPRHASRPLPSVDGANSASTSKPSTSTSSSSRLLPPTPQPFVSGSGSRSSTTFTVRPPTALSRASSIGSVWSQDSALPTGVPPTRRQSFAASYHYKVTTDEQRELDTLIATWSKLDALLSNKGVDHIAPVDVRPALPPMPASMYDKVPRQLKRVDTAAIGLMLIERRNRASRTPVMT